jgi:hypothetical protein
LTNLLESFDLLERFSKNIDLTLKISEIERSLKNANQIGLLKVLEKQSINEDLLNAALIVKDAASQINVIIHTVGILTALPNILQPDECIEYLSLGAGNTGRDFDLVTNKRIAEFKFINWKGGSETIRQNKIFVDFFKLVMEPSNKKKELYVLDKKFPIKFLNGNRALQSVLSKDNSAKEKFYTIYGEKYTVVSNYYSEFHNEVMIIDLKEIASEFRNIEIWDGYNNENFD